MERSRPRKKKLKRRCDFSETRIGYLLSRTAPLEYSLILDASGDYVPSPDLIEALSYTSLEPVFRTCEFREALIDYRRYRLHPRKITNPTPKKEMNYIQYRKGRASTEKSRWKSSQVLQK